MWLLKELKYGENTSSREGWARGGDVCTHSKCLGWLRRQVWAGHLHGKFNLRRLIGMVKLIVLLKRNRRLTLEEFTKYWYEQFGPMAKELLPPLVRRYVQNHALKLGGKGEPQIDGVSELWFDDLESFQQYGNWVLSDASKPMLEEEEKFMERSKLIFFVCEEKVIKA